MNKTKSIARCAVLMAILCISSQFKIPLPYVPISLQWTVIILISFLLPRTEAAFTVATYVFLGLAGLPVFAGGGGLSYILKPSFGFLIGFIAAAWTSSWIYHLKNKPDFWHGLFSGIAGMITNYLIALPYLSGIFYYVLDVPFTIDTLLISYCITFIPSDIIGIAIVSLLTKHLPKH